MKFQLALGPYVLRTPSSTPTLNLLPQSSSSCCPGGVLLPSLWVQDAAGQRLSLDKSILQVPPCAELYPLPHPELSPVLPALPPASFPLSIAALQGKRHLSGKTNETELPKPGRVQRARRADPGDGDPVPPKMTCLHASASPHFFLCRCLSLSSPQRGWEASV